MIVLRFKVTCRPEKTDAVLAAMADVVAPSRALEGVINFDVARDVTDPDSLIAIAVFEDDAARERQESLPEVAKVLAMLEDALTEEPEATVYRVSSFEPAL